VAGLRGASALGDILERGLAAIPAVHDVSASPLTGNVVVHYDRDLALDRITERIAALARGDIQPPGEQVPSPQWHTADPAAAARELGTSITRGLSAAERRRRLASVGRNALPSLRERSDLSIWLGQFTSMPVGLLAGAAALSVAAGGIVEAGAILAVLALNGIIGFATERHAERTIRSLGAAEPVGCHVLEDGIPAEVASDTLVPGDVIMIGRGMLVPADARLVTSRALTVSEAALTGESLPVAKSIAPLDGARLPLGDRSNMIYRGTLVTGGSGSAVVVATGSGTEIGRIQRLVGTTAAPETLAQRQLAVLGTQLIWATFAGSGVILGLGWLRGIGLVQLLRSSLAVAVAAVPEGLPMMATATLAFGVEQLRRRGVLVRRLTALETLATVNVVCFDKTGTLTCGSMSPEAVVVGNRICRLNDGELIDQRGTTLRQGDDARLRRLFAVASLCSETQLDDSNGEIVLTGSATENALVSLALEGGTNVVGLRQEFPRQATQHRTEAYRFMATTHRTTNGRLVAVKGNPSEVLERCTWEGGPDGRRKRLSSERRLEIERLNAALADRALRVLGFAYAELLGHRAEPGHSEVSNLTWIGLVGLADPVRSGIRELMQSLHCAGIQTIMLTGDQSATARAVAEEIGLGPDHDVQILDSTAVEQLMPAELGAAARRTHAFARISPGQKLRIVRALQQSGAVVAMMGDGFNDSPALRAADVGIGLAGPQSVAAREIADIFIASQQPSAMLAAIRQGRGTYGNMRRAMRYILSTNASEIMLMVAGTAAGVAEPLSPLQLLWINLASDVLPAVGLAMETADPKLMDRPPRRPDEPIVARNALGPLAADAGILTAGAAGAGLFTAIRYGMNAPQVRHVTFGSLITAQLLHAITCRSPQSVPGSSPFASSPALFGIVAASLALQSAGLLIPPLRSLFGFAPIGIADAMAMVIGGMLPFLLNEARRNGAVPAGLPTLRFSRLAAQPHVGPSHGSPLRDHGAAPGAGTAA
jgi:P-type Ca2+ transporter type 2C